MPRVVARALREWNLLQEHKQAERALRQSELRFRTVARLSSDFAYSCARAEGGDCVVDWITDAFYALTGFGEAQLREHENWLFVVHPDDREVAAEPLRRLRPGETDASEFRIVTEDGRIRWFANRMECEAEPGTADGLRFYGAVRDVTERRGAEDEMRRLNAELERRVRQRTQQLQALNGELEAFAYSVSHDLKAPLRGIDGYSRLLLEKHADRMDADGRAFLTHIRQGALRMEMLIDDLLTYSRMERRALQSGSVEVAGLARSVVAERAAEIQARGVDLRLELPVLAVRADPEGLAQVLRNLLDNALKFSRDSSMVEIGGRSEADRVVLWVKDDGIGFDMRFHDRIFEIFQRLHRAEDYPGTGIGLAIARKAAQRMGGRVWAESAPDAGATFYLELPA
jgi:PAS domain S-box-containing protein